MFIVHTQKYIIFFLKSAKLDMAKVPDGGSLMAPFFVPKIHMVNEQIWPEKRWKQSKRFSENFGLKSRQKDVRGVVEVLGRKLSDKKFLEMLFDRSAG